MKYLSNIHPFRLICVERCTSTQDLVRQWIDENYTSHIAYLAFEQLKGRGRSGHTWFSPKGGLYFSFAIPLSTTPISRFPLLCGLTLAKLLEEEGLAPMLKWPNDCLIKGKKVAGILCELYKGQIIAGIGVNLHIPLEILSPDLRERSTSLHLHGVNIDGKTLAQSFLAELPNQLDKPPFLIKKTWHSKDALYGKTILAHMGRETLTGTAQGIDEDGCLLLNANEKVVRVRAGEVTLSKKT